MTPSAGTQSTETDVLIVGGGPIGLTASIGLSRFGVDTVLVNQRAATSRHPRARFIDVRTIEIFHQLEVADAVIETALPPEWVQSVRYSTTWAEPEVFRLPTDSYHSVPRSTSPTIPVMTSQDLVEPILLDAARSYDPADVRFATEIVALDEHAGGCRAIIADVDTGEESVVEAQYVIGADGRSSTVRDLIASDVDSSFAGRMRVQDVLLEADLSPWLGDRIGALLFVNHPRGYGLFQPVDARHRFRAQCTTFRPHVDHDDVTDEHRLDWIRSAIGDEAGEAEIEIISRSSWQPEARLSDLFRRGRVFLAGDAAHTLMPTGGYGMNLGYHGVHNLVWKLAYVLHGWSDPSILDTYETERRPQADRTRHASVRNAMLAGELYATHDRGEPLDDVVHRLRQYGNFEGMILGAEYDSDLVHPDPGPAPVVDDDIIDFVPCVRPGRRAPHVWLDEGGDRSVLDCFGKDFIVLAGPHADPMIQRSVDELARAGVPIRAEEMASSTGDLYPEHQAFVVRPDGIVAARVRGATIPPLHLKGQR